jgi:hypothetical protein
MLTNPAAMKQDDLTAKEIASQFPQKYPYLVSTKINQ